MKRGGTETSTEFVKPTFHVAARILGLAYAVVCIPFECARGNVAFASQTLSFSPNCSWRGLNVPLAWPNG